MFRSVTRSMQRVWQLQRQCECISYKETLLFRGSGPSAIQFLTVSSPKRPTSTPLRGQILWTKSPFCDNTMSLSFGKLSHALCKPASFKAICQETSVVPAILSTNTPRSLSFRLLGSVDRDKTRASHGPLFGVVQFCRCRTDTLNDTTGGKAHYRGHHCSKNSHIRVTKRSLMQPTEVLAETSAQS